MLARRAGCVRVPPLQRDNDAVRVRRGLTPSQSAVGGSPSGWAMKRPMGNEPKRYDVPRAYVERLCENTD
jgi:hypothetical protein